ncbi:hypothetical protein F4561_001109 [Lipingzhangella halophila]|uniref:DUF397 domain-containing protein n=1 Tax=Lipingzhangella halophila TaxID=1783352 RepID=A0A7W7RE17_9ACTN|nr:DUF397 domain-containing protein [Lipingzhangella halophila]MBB4930289.1 hypothetical protein [Lipingzhangella halophila]
MSTPDISRRSPRAWRTSTYSDANGGHCVEVATEPHATAIRDTQNRHHTTLTIPNHEWHAFLHHAKHDAF